MNIIKQFIFADSAICESKAKTNHMFSLWYLTYNLAEKSTLTQNCIKF